jgi:hypothetical protein
MNETQAGSAGAPDGGGHRGGSGEECAPLQTRAAFLQNWSWESVVSINRRACERGQAQHGINSEAGAQSEEEWELIRLEQLTLLETWEVLRSFHRKAPFLFFNGNTFSFIGRELALVLFGDLPALRRREISSAVAHYIAGVLDRESMISIVDSLCQTAAFAVGDRVETLRGSTTGTIRRILEDGRIVWLPDGGGLEFTCLPESLRPIRN